MPSQAPSGVRTASAATGRPADVAARIFSWTAFPVVMTAAVWVTLRLLARGVEPTLAFFAQLASPFRWSQLKREAAAARGR